MRLHVLPNKLRGFTYVELMIVLGILIALLALVSVTIVPALTRSNVGSHAQILVSDLFSQQQKSMQGEQSSSNETTPFGVYFQPEYYVLFQGSTYDANHPDNIVISLPATLSFSDIQVPNDTILFERLTGEVADYNPSENTVTLSPDAGGTASVLQVNRYGVVEMY